VPVSVMTTLMPILAAAWTVNRERALRITWLAAEYLTVASLGGLAVSLVVARPLTVLLYGEDFASAAPALPVLAGAFVFICFGYLTGNLVLIAGLQRRLVTIGLVGLVVNVAGNVVLIPAWGFMGAAWMTLATEAAVVIVTAVMLRRRLELTLPSLGRMARILAAAATLALMLEISSGLGGSFAVLLAIAALAYPGLLLGLRAIDLDEIRMLLRERAAAS
jgi:O-antigen/teichoic acid export membrane protein